MRTMGATMVWLVAMAGAWGAAPPGGRPVAAWKWADVPAADLPGKVVDVPKLGKVLRIEHRDAAPKNFALCKWKPGLGTAFYFVRGQVRCDDVEGDGYLEMWNDFGAGGRFFTRTMGQQGPMQMVRGTSKWRAFCLPFNGTGAAGKPETLEVNLVLAGKGTVEIGNLELFEFADAGAMWAAMGAGSSALPPHGPPPWWVPAAMGATAGAGGFAVWCWWSRQRQSRELRRMRAHDAG